MHCHGSAETPPSPAHGTNTAPLMRRARTCVALIACATGLAFGSAVATLGLVATHTATSAPLPAHPFALRLAHAASGPVPKLAIKLAPNELAIPALGVVAPLQAEDIADHSLTIPGNVHIVGIWTGGGKTGGRVGTVLLAGHVNYFDQGNGALYDLSNIQPGAQIYVSGPTGRLDAWTATSLRSYPKANLPQDIFTASGPRRLVVVTCGGPFDAQSGHYLDNVVLSASPVRSPDPTMSGPHHLRDSHRVPLVTTGSGGMRNHRSVEDGGSTTRPTWIQRHRVN